MKRFAVVCGATLGLLVIAAVIAAALATRPVKIIIPAGAGYPETTIAFRVGRLGGDHAIVYATSLKFASPEWTANFTGGRWKQSTGGSYLSFACEASSTACMQATKGTGNYRYVLYPFTGAAPSRTGEYRVAWDVQPPGDVLLDEVIVPDPSSLVLFASGGAMLCGLFARRRRQRSK